jgi:hypothetical protein
LEKKKIISFKIITTKTMAVNVIEKEQENNEPKNLL